MSSTTTSNEERSSSLSLSNLSDLPEEIRNELINIILRKVQEEIRLGNVDPNEIGPDGKTIFERIREICDFPVVRQFDGATKLIRNDP